MLTAALTAALSTLLTVLAWTCAAPARAGDEMGLSRDGKTWSDTLDGPLFDPDVRWVPGDVRTARFRVRNQAADEAVLSIAVQADPRDTLLRDRHLTVAARVERGDWTTLERVGDRYPLGGSVLGTGDDTEVTVRATFAAAAPNASQARETQLGFTVTLASWRADAGGPGTGEGPGGSTGQQPTGPADGPTEGPGGAGTPTPAATPVTPPGATPGEESATASGLPGVGAPAVGWLVVLAGVLVGTGAALVRRREDER